MDDFEIDSKPLCFQHNQPAILYTQQLSSQEQFLCKACLEQRQFTLIDDFLDKQKKVFNQIQTKSDLSLKLLRDLLEFLDIYKQNLIKIIDNLSNTLNQQTKIFSDKQSNFKSLFKKYKLTTVEIISQEEKSFLDVMNMLNDKLDIQLAALRKATSIDNFSELLNNYRKKIDLNIEDYQHKQNENLISQIDGVSTQSSIVIDKKFDFQLIQQSIYKQNEWCGAIAFNKNSSIMIAGCDKMIKVFEFKDDKLTQVQQLNGHSYYVFCLQFMRKSNQFISGSYDSTIKIWEQSQNYQWQSNQVLQSHTSYIRCITMNQNEDILISGSEDKTIKFWNLQNNIWSSNQSIDCQSYVYSISLNNKEDQLIASVYNEQILIIQLQDKQWIIKQKITVEQCGYRLCYINSDQFVFQPYDRQHLQIFDYDPKDQFFKKAQELQYSNKASDNNCLFPIRYISQIELIMVKNAQHVHLIKRSQNGQFTVEQSINFNTNYLYGGISDDGRYIATWDNKSKEIQIRKFEY